MNRYVLSRQPREVLEWHCLVTEKPASRVPTILNRTIPPPSLEASEPPSEILPEAERRGGTRAPIELRVEYQRLNSFFADYTKNISRGGTFIRTERPLPIGTDFVFKLAVPDMEVPLTLNGRVQWLVQPEDADDEHDPGMGIGFVYNSELDRQRVEKIVEAMMVRSLGPILYDKLVGNRQASDEEP